MVVSPHLAVGTPGEAALRQWVENTFAAAEVDDLALTGIRVADGPVPEPYEAIIKISLTAHEPDTARAVLLDRFGAFDPDTPPAPAGTRFPGSRPGVWNVHNRNLPVRRSGGCPRRASGHPHQGRAGSRDVRADRPERGREKLGGPRVRTPVQFGLQPGLVDRGGPGVLGIPRSRRVGSTTRRARRHRRFAFGPNGGTRRARGARRAAARRADEPVAAGLRRGRRSRGPAAQSTPSRPRPVPTRDRHVAAGGLGRIRPDRPDRCVAPRGQRPLSAPAVARRGPAIPGRTRRGREGSPSRVVQRGRFDQRNRPADGSGRRAVPSGGGRTGPQFRRRQRDRVERRLHPPEAQR